MVFEALKNGAKHYIMKPIDPTKLLGIVNELLEESNEDVIEKKDETKETKPGFKIDNLNGKFIVTFNEHLGIKDHITLETAVKGLLFVQPLNIVFDFDNLDEINEVILNPIIRIGNTIVNSGGNLQYKSNSERIAEMLQEVK